jgi:prepilin-type N-terminal cleavage/methylation domain-containing protein
MKFEGIPKGREDGFTLIEILVGLLVSSLIMVGLSLSMKTIDMGFNSAAKSLERQSTLATGLGIVAGDIARIQPVVDEPEHPTQFLFSGRRREAIYILAERPGNNQAGLYWVRLLVRKAAGGEELVRMRAPYARGQTAPPENSWNDEVVLLRGELAIEISYRAPRTGLRSWSGDWLAKNQLPGEIKLEIADIRTGRLRVPVFVGVLKIDAEADCVSPQAAGCTIDSGGIIGGGGSPNP